MPSKQYVRTPVMCALVIALVIIVVLAGCQPTVPPTAAPQEQVIIVRPLATIAPTATPDPARQPPTAAPAFIGIPPTATPLPTPTAYIGVFLGETQEQLGGEAVERQLPEFEAASGDAPLLCLAAPDTVFGTNWIEEDRVRTALRCPIQQSFGFEGRIQVFERGAIYWRVETGEMWAIAPGRLERGDAVGVGQYWYVDVSPQFQPGSITAPEGLQIPSGNIGGVWASIPEVQQALGFAVADVQDIGVNLQRFEGGTLFLDVTVGQAFALLLNGDAFGPYAQ